MISGRAISSAVRGWATTTARRVFQRQVIYSTSGLMPYIRPPFHALALVPLGLLRYGTAFEVSVSGQILLLVSCLVWAHRRFGPRAALIGSMFTPTSSGIARGQIALSGCRC
jgi:hypothetical protein